MHPRDYIAALADWGLTQMQIAERTGLAQSTISKVARGDVSDILSQSYLRLRALYEEVRDSRQAAEREPASRPEAEGPDEPAALNITERRSHGDRRSDAEAA